MKRAASLLIAGLAAAALTGVAVAQEPDPPTTGGIVVHLDEQNGSGIDGRAEIFPAEGGARTKVQVFVNEVQPGSSHAAMLHLGCTGPIAANLNNVVADDGVTTGRSITTVNAPFSTVANGKHTVDVHGADGSIIACGVIPAQPAAPETLPPTGAGAATEGSGWQAALAVALAGIGLVAGGTALRRHRT